MCICSDTFIDPQDNFKDLQMFTEILRPLLDLEDAGHVTREHHPTHRLVFSLFSTDLCQRCLLKQMRAMLIYE